MVKEPEQERYTTVLTISYADLQRQEDVYVLYPGAAPLSADVADGAM